ncbi:MAG: elongation factor Ts [Candidatus Limnocylindria bacterium]
MATNAKDVARLRGETGAGVMECKRALEDSRGDFEKARALIRERGLEKAARKSDRAANEGIVEAYIHAGGRIGALVELSSETDFVARNPEFRALAREIAMQVAATSPKYVSEDQLTGDDKGGRPEDLVLLRQPYIRDVSKTVGDIVTAYAAKTGENVRIGRICRFELGRTA